MNRIGCTLLMIFAFVVFVNAQNSTFKITTWNTEWLSCSINGPTDEQLQVNNVAKVIKALDVDVVALQEVGTSSTYSTIDTLVRRLGSEWGGSIIPWSADNCNQNQGIIYKKSKVQFVSASLMSSAGTSYNWSSGRFPVLYNLNLVVGNSTVPVALINIHAKAMSDESSYARRKAASLSLKALLDGNSYNTKNVILLGDFNDYLTGTQCRSCSPAESPYKNFVDDTQNYKGLTGGLYDPNYNSPVIDNIIISDELFDNYSNAVLRETTAAQVVPNFTSTTSDHYPISATFSFGDGPAGCQNFSFSETFGQSLGAFTQQSVQGTQTWGWRAQYGAVISGYQNSVANPNEDWLVSPALDLSGSSSATLHFEHALNYAGTVGDNMNNYSLWITDGYSSGLPSTANWTKLTIPTMPAGNNWTFVNSGDITIPTDLMKQNIRFAFKYQSNETVAATWEVRNITVDGKCNQTQSDPPLLETQSKVYAAGGIIKIENKQAMPVSVFDITGRILYSVPAIQNSEFDVMQQGIYIVRCGNKVVKVVVD